MKRLLSLLLILSLLALSAPLAGAAGEGVAPAPGYAEVYGIRFPFTPSQRTSLYTFEVLDGETVVSKKERVTVTSKQNIFLPMTGQVGVLAQPRAFTLRVTAHPMPGREELDLQTVKLIPFQNEGTCGHLYASGAFMIGEGSESNPYLVSTPAQLNHVRVHMDAHFKQTAHLDMTGVAWAPIAVCKTNSGGVTGTPFHGHYDGDGYTIRNLAVTVTSGSGSCGVFGAIDGVVENLGVVDSSFTILNDRTGDIGTITGGMCGQGRLENCFSVGCTLSSTYLNSDGGGIVGQAIEQSTIQNCYARDISISAGSSASGIMGPGSASITNCYAVPVSLASVNDRPIAGLTASASAPVSGCYYLSDPSWEKGQGVSCTREQLQTPATFAGWDAAVWNLSQGSYPSLKIERPLARTRDYALPQSAETGGEPMLNG